MKRFIIAILIMFICCITSYSQATDLEVDCQTPGWLSSKINYGDQQTVKKLKVTGYINSDDLKFIGELISNQNLNEKVDLSDVNIVNNSLDNNCFGISKYIDITLKCLSLPKTVEKLNSILPYDVYSNGTKLAMHIDTLYFNCNVDYIDGGMFGAHQYDEMPHHIIIGEKVETIPENAFGGKKGVISVIMPTNLKYIGEGAFSQTDYNVEKTNINDLKNLKYLGVRAFPGYQPDTLIVPKSLDNPFYLFSFAHKDNQHIFIENNINTISGYAIGSGGKWTTSYIDAKIIFHINNTTPPSIANFRGNNLDNSTVYVPRGAKQAYLNSDWKNATIIETTLLKTLNITSSGNGSVLYDNSIIKNQTKTFSIEEGSSAIIEFSPDNGYRVASVKLNGIDLTSSITNNQYTINN